MGKVCDICGGSGQIGIFRGLSRFVIGWEECPECFGTGLDNPTGETGEASNRSPADEKTDQNSPNKDSKK